jgi:hypothetical protein
MSAPALQPSALPPKANNAVDLEKIPVDRAEAQQMRKCREATSSWLPASGTTPSWTSLRAFPMASILLLGAGCGGLAGLIGSGRCGLALTRPSGVSFGGDCLMTADRQYRRRFALRLQLVKHRDRDPAVLAPLPDRE